MSATDDRDATDDGSAFIDARCPKCGAHVGWHGRMSDRPACPKCGHRPAQASPGAGGWANNTGQRWASRAARTLDEINPGWHRNADVMDCPDSFVLPILRRLLADGGIGRKRGKHAGR
jgi:ribosomal protein S27E